MEQINKEIGLAARSMHSTNESDEVAIMAVIRGVSEAFRSKDIKTVMSYYASDVVAYDMMPPLSFHNASEYRSAWQNALDGMTEAGQLEIAEKECTISGDLAVLHSLCHMTGTLKKNKQKIDSWTRYTGVFKKINGNWLIVHEHSSVPIDMESEKPCWDLKPQDKATIH